MNEKCKNCGAQFMIENDDLKFYEKISPTFNGKKYPVPQPTECPDCRQQRRLAFRNERMLYHDNCACCKEPMISIYSPDKKYQVYCSKCWWGDTWDSMVYGRDYDFSRPFFEQWDELWESVPKLNLLVLGENENSAYTHDNYRLKNCYLTFDGEQAMDCYYGETFSKLKDCVDFLNIQQSELCYECVNCVDSYKLMFSRYCYNCSNSAFLVDCVGCKNCLGCVNLHRKEYHIFNKPYSSEEYNEKLKVLNLSNYNHLQNFKKEFEEFCTSQPKKAMRGMKNENVSGDNLVECKDTFESFDCRGLRDCKFCTNVIMGAQDCYDVNIWGDSLSLAYNSAGVGAGAQEIIASYYAGFNANNIYHSAFCWRGARNIFGCVRLGHKEHCILNKQYSEDEYQQLASKITEKMIESGEFGQFFPIQLSEFGYNETVAQEYYPLTKEQVLEKGYKWKDPDPKEYQKQTYKTPDDIKEIKDSIIQELLACSDCGKNYKIIKQELEFYRKMNLPIPHKCSDCRHGDRMKLRNPRKLWERKCNKCNTEIKSTYSPERTEEVYCEKCYLEIVV